ncbi:MAG: hypothetical protein Q7K34_03055 [archaeon]|nr:hypothetical protein [archaeon]
MVYGLSFEEINKKNQPVQKKTSWGFEAEVSKKKSYYLEQFFVKKGGIQPLHSYQHRDGSLYVQEGKIVLRVGGKNGEKILVDMKEGDVLDIARGTAHGAFGAKDSFVYFFAGGSKQNGKAWLETEQDAAKNFSSEKKSARMAKPGKTTDFRDKYWGSIETIVSRNYCGKKIVMKKGMQNSLEFHCNKFETYFVHSGNVKVGVRIGRAENKSISLRKGETFDIIPGLMHMKIAEEDCIVMEISTRDDDSDSHLVEDGMKYVHKEI